LRGKIVFLTFFSKSCKPCRKEVPFLNELMGRYPEKLFILAVAYMEDDPQKISETAKEWGMEYTVCVDPSGVAAKSFEVRDLPRGFLLDAEGRLVASYVGLTEQNNQDLVKKIDNLYRLMNEQQALGPMFWVEPAFAVQEGDASLGVKWAEYIRQLIGSSGKRVAPSKEIANYFVSGNVLAIEDTIAIEVIIKDISGKEVSKFSTSVIGGDDSTLRTVLKRRLDILK
jgi:thiol-disulfide isomerase/thioredoxin